MGRSGKIFLESSQYFYWFVGLNLVFLIFNTPLFLALLFLELTPANSLYFYLAFLPFGASLTATFACFNKLKHELDLLLIKDFWKFYKVAMRKSTVIWTVASLIVYIIILNINFLQETPFSSLLLPPYLILILLLASTTITSLYLLASDEKERVIEAVKVAAFLSIKKGYIGIFNLTIFAMWLFVIFIRPVLGLGLMPSVIVFLMAKNHEFIVTYSQV